MVLCGEQNDGYVEWSCDADVADDGGDGYGDEHVDGPCASPLLVWVAVQQCPCSLVAAVFLSLMAMRLEWLVEEVQVLGIVMCSVFGHVLAIAGSSYLLAEHVLAG